VSIIELVVTVWVLALSAIG